MKHKVLLSALAAGAIGALAGCAHTTPASGGPESMQADAASDAARWTANIRSVTQNSGQVAQSTRDRSYGSATWTVRDARLSTVSLVFTYAGDEKFLSWAIIPGSCGTGALPIMPSPNFPEINVGSGGRGQVTASLPMDLPANGAYHVNIYRDRRQGVESLVACGELKYAG